VRRGELCQRERGEEIEIEKGAGFIDRRGGGSVVRAAARIVNKDVDLSPALHGFVDQAGPDGGVGKIAGYDKRFGTAGIAKARFIAGGQSQTGAAAREDSGQPGADSLRRACDYDNLSGEQIHANPGTERECMDGPVWKTQ